MSEIFGVPKSTVADIWKIHNKITKHVSSAENPSVAKQRCIVRSSQFPLLDVSLSMWFVQLRAKGAAVPTAVIQEQALTMFKSLYPDAEPGSFKASLGWLEKLKRHGVRELVLHGESLSADTALIGPFREDLLAFIDKEGLTYDHIFNADETGLLWRGPPSRSLCHDGETQARNFQRK